MTPVKVWIVWLPSTHLPKKTPSPKQGCQILADQLTPSQPGGTDYAHKITTGTPGFSDFPTALSRRLALLSWRKSLTCCQRPYPYPTYCMPSRPRRHRTGCCCSCLGCCRTPNHGHVRRELPNLGQSFSIISVVVSRSVTSNECQL